MSYNNTIADLLTRIRNAYMVGLKHVYVRKSKVTSQILDVLKKEGYILNHIVAEKEGDDYVYRNVKLHYKPFHDVIALSYVNKKPAVKDIRVISTPSRKVYAGYEKLPRFYSGYALTFLSTSQGIIPDYSAIKKKIGGEVLFYVF